MQEMQVQPLGQEDPLEKDMATLYSFFFFFPTLYSCLGKSHGQRRLAGYNPWSRKRMRHNLATKQQQQQQSKRANGDVTYQHHLSLLPLFRQRATWGHTGCGGSDPNQLWLLTWCEPQTQNTNTGKWCRWILFVFCTNT